MGFFGGLITFQAVIVLFAAFFAVGFVFGIGVCVAIIEERFPEIYKSLKAEIEWKRKDE